MGKFVILSICLFLCLVSHQASTGKFLDQVAKSTVKFERDRTTLYKICNIHFLDLQERNRKQLNSYLLVTLETTTQQDIYVCTMLLASLRLHNFRWSSVLDSCYSKLNSKILQKTENNSQQISVVTIRVSVTITTRNKYKKDTYCNSKITANDKRLKPTLWRRNSKLIITIFLGNEKKVYILWQFTHKKDI